MERVLLDQLEWRVVLPTTYGALHLLTQLLAGRLPPRAIALAAYLAELSLLDYGMLAHAPSRVAAAAIAAGAAWHAPGGAGAVAVEIEAATGGGVGQSSDGIPPFSPPVQPRQRAPSVVQTQSKCMQHAQPARLPQTACPSPARRLCACRSRPLRSAAAAPAAVRGAR
jgi:hypothetical protein